MSADGRALVAGALLTLVTASLLRKRGAVSKERGARHRGSRGVVRRGQTVFPEQIDGKPVRAAIARAKKEILKDIAEQRVPATVSSFSDLHDYVDANTYGGLCDENFWGGVGGEDEDVDVAFLAENYVQNALDEWIRSPGFQATGQRAIAQAHARMDRKFKAASKYDGSLGLVRRPKLPAAPAVHVAASVQSDNGQHRAFFNAVPYLEQASAEEIAALVECDWGGDYPADEVARWMVDLDKGVAKVMRRVEKDGLGFEVHIDDEEATTWLDTHRPGWRETGSKGIVRGTMTASTMCICGYDRNLHSESGHPISQDAEYGACITCYSEDKKPCSGYRSAKVSK